MNNHLGNSACWYKLSGGNNPLQVDEVLPQNFFDENEAEIDDSSQIVVADTVALILDRVISHVAPEQPSQLNLQVSDKRVMEINQNCVDNISVVNITTKAVKVTDSSSSKDFGTKMDPDQGGSMGTISFCTVFSSSEDDDDEEEEEEFSKSSQKIQFSNTCCKSEPSEKSSELKTQVETLTASQIDGDSEASAKGVTDRPMSLSPKVFSSLQSKNSDVTKLGQPSNFENKLATLGVPNLVDKNATTNNDICASVDDTVSVPVLTESDSVPASPVRAVLTMSPYSGNRQIAKVMPYYESQKDGQITVCETVAPTSTKKDLEKLSSVQKLPTQTSTQTLPYSLVRTTTSQSDGHISTVNSLASKSASSTSAFTNHPATTNVTSVTLATASSVLSETNSASYVPDKAADASSAPDKPAAASSAPDQAGEPSNLLRLKSVSSLMRPNEGPTLPGSSPKEDDFQAIGWHSASISTPPKDIEGKEPTTFTGDQMPSLDFCKKVSFKHAEQELKLIYHINTTSLQTSSSSTVTSLTRRYHILTSTSVLFLRLFISEHVISTLPQTAAEWQDVYIGFYPNRETPSHVRIFFSRGSKREIIAKLPSDHEATHTLVNQNCPCFTLSYLRVKGLNSKFYEAYNKPFISHAFYSADGTAMAVNLEAKNVPYAVPLFAHLNNSAVIDENVRKRTKGHIALAFHHHKVTRVDALTLENIIFEKSNKIPSTYRQLICKSVELEILKKNQPTPQHFAGQHPALPQVPTQANSFPAPRRQNRNVRLVAPNFAHNSQLNSGQIQRSSAPMSSFVVPSPQIIGVSPINPVTNTRHLICPATTSVANDGSDNVRVANEPFIRPQWIISSPQNCLESNTVTMPIITSVTSGAQNTAVPYGMPVISNVASGPYTNQISSSSFPVITNVASGPIAETLMRAFSEQQPPPAQLPAAKSKDQETNKPGSAPPFEETSITNQVAILQSNAVSTLQSVSENNRGIQDSNFWCKICNTPSLDKKSFLGHLTGMHFCVQVAGLPSQTGPIKCHIDDCNKTFLQHSLLAQHMAIKHSRVEEFYVKVVDAILPFGGVDRKLFRCSVQSKTCHVINTLNDHLVHVTQEHFAQELLQELKDFQSVLLLGPSDCPIDDCKITYALDGDLVKHYGVDHCRSIDLMINNRQGELNTSLKILKLYREAMGFAQIQCPLMVTEDNLGTDNVCCREFGSLVGLHYHLSSSHFNSRLFEIFKKHSKDDDSAEKELDRRLCPYCSKSLDLKTGVVHMGVAHKVTSFILSAITAKLAAALKTTESLSTTTALQPPATTAVISNTSAQLATANLTTQQETSTVAGAKEQTVEISEVSVVATVSCPPVKFASVTAEEDSSNAKTSVTKIAKNQESNSKLKIKVSKNISAQNKDQNSVEKSSIAEENFVKPKVDSNSSQDIGNSTDSAGSKLTESVEQNCKNVSKEAKTGAGVDSSLLNDSCPQMRQLVKPKPKSALNQTAMSESFRPDSTSTPQNNKDCKTKVVEAPMASKKSKPGPQSSKNIISSLESKSGKSTESKTDGSSKTMTNEVLGPASWFYKCPYCEARFCIPHKKTASADKLACHIVNKHRPGQFELHVAKSSPLCPAGCKKQTLNMTEMSKHVQNFHSIFVNDFVKKEIDGFIFANCFQDPSKLKEAKATSTSATSSTPTPSATFQQIFDEYLKFCKMRKLDSKKCDVTWINIFFTSSRVNLKPEPNELLQALTLIGKHHVKQPNGDTVDKHRLMEAFKAKLAATKLVKELPKTAQTFEATKLVKELPKTAQVSGQNDSEVKEKSNEISEAKTAKNPLKSSTLESAGATTVAVDRNMIFVCYSCNTKYFSMSSLMHHIKSKPHREVKLGCKFCNTFFVIKKHQMDDLSSSLILHTYCPGHLANRWNFLNKEGKIATNSKENSSGLRETTSGILSKNAPGFVKCEACAKDVPNLRGHLLNKQHQDNTTIINHYIQFCNFRDICPVTCSVQDINFYFDTVFPKTKHNKQNKFNVTILQILKVLSHIHDPIDDMDLSAEVLIGDHITELLSSASAIAQPIPPFVCFACPKTESNLDLFVQHCQSQAHLKAVAERRIATLGNVIFCESCSKSFSAIQHVVFHFYSKAHLSSAWKMLKSDSYPPTALSEPDDHCYLCSRNHCNVEHLTSEDHLQLVDQANKYLDFCKNANLNPVSCCENDLTLFLTSNMTCQNDISVPKMLNVLDKLHQPIDGKSILKIPSVAKLLEIEKSSFEETLEPPQKGQTANLEDTSVSVYQGLSKEELELVSTCPVCQKRFPHATFVIYHASSEHKMSPKRVLEQFFYLKSLKVCSKCNITLESELSLALHLDRHDHPIRCQHCQMSFISRAHYYRKDSCNRNKFIQASVKDSCETNIKEFIISQTVSSTDSKESRKSTTNSSSASTCSTNQSSKIAKRKMSESENAPPAKRFSTVKDSHKEAIPKPSIDLKSDPKLKLRPGVVVSKEEKSMADLEIENYLPKTKLDTESALPNVQSEVEPFSKSDDRVEPSFEIKLELQVDTQVAPSAKRKLEEEPSSSSAKKSRASPESSSQQYYKIFKYANKHETVPGKIFGPVLVRVSGFCLDCEGCESGCRHLDHPRRFVQDLSIHKLETSHRKYQTVRDFFKSQCAVSIEELALSSTNGHRIRKQFKKFVKSAKEKDVTWHYGFEKPCRIKGCIFSTASVVDMFRHIREKHLPASHD